MRMGPRNKEIRLWCQPNVSATLSSATRVQTRRIACWQHNLSPAPSRTDPLRPHMSPHPVPVPAALHSDTKHSGTTRSGGAPSQLTSTYVTHLVATGQLQHHIQTVLCPAYALRYAKLIAAISAYLLPLGFALPQSDREIVGGYFVWLGLPPGLKAVDLAKVCREEEAVVIAAGAVFEIPGDASAAFPGHVRICFAWEAEARLREGIESIGKVARKLLAESLEKTDNDESGKRAKAAVIATDAFK